MIKIVERQLFEGPSVYCHKPVVRLSLQLEEYAKCSSKDIPGLTEALKFYFPGLVEHDCSQGKPGDFIMRLEEGTYLPHIFEHLCLEVQHILGYPVRYGKSRHLTEDIYTVIFAYQNKQVLPHCIDFIFKLLCSILYEKPFEFDKALAELFTINERYRPGPSTAAIIQEAQRRGIPVEELHGSGVVRLGYGRRQRLFAATLYEGTSSVAVDIACDKALTKAVLEEVNIPTPKGRTCLTFEEALETADSLQFPIVLKPKTGNHGKGVFVSIKTVDELKWAFDQIKALKEDEVIVEKHVVGRDFRILVINGKMEAAAERIPPHIVGNGVHAVGEWIEIMNNSPERGEGHEKPLTRIKLDAYTQNLLHKQRIDFNDVPAMNQVVWLRESGNISTGGIAVDCTEEVHPKNKAFAELAAQTLGLDIAGIDMVIPDIKTPLTWENGAIVEVNAAPGIRMHLYPVKGEPRNVAVPILNMMIPPEESAVIPIVAITGTNGKTTTTRMLSHILQKNGGDIGMTTTHGIYINGMCVEEGDTTGSLSSKRLLHDRHVDAVVLETARGGILKGGLGYNKADVAIFTNLTGDHLGMDGIDTMEDMLHIKSLVVEAVKPDGYTILNADDPWVMKAKACAKGTLILFSMRIDSERIQRQLKTGGEVVCVLDGTIYILKGKFRRKLMEIQEIPALLDGALIHNVYNALGAIAAAYALKVPVETIASAMVSFTGDADTNPGRFNIYDMGHYKIVLDYGHNMDGYQNTVKGLKGLDPKRLVGIIGVPGDRRDVDIRAIGMYSGEAFDTIIIREDEDKRGRELGEVASRLYESALIGGIAKDKVQTILGECAALTCAIQEARPGDVIVVFFEKLEPLVELIQSTMLQEQQPKELVPHS